MIINGRQIASEILEDLKKGVEKLKRKNITPYLYIITLGKNSESTAYIKQKLLKAEIINAKTTVKKLSEKTTTNKLISLIESLNNDKKVSGIIVQRPIPKRIDGEKTALAIDSKKDVDGFRPHSPFKAPVALAVLKLIESTLKNESILEMLKRKKIAIIGKGITAGRPTINLFQTLGLKITIIDSKTKDKDMLIKRFDIVVSCVGKDKILTADNIKRNAILIGVGMHTENGKLKGDYDENEIKDKASFYTPTPGGVGPVNVSYLMKNLVEAAGL